MNSDVFIVTYLTIYFFKYDFFYILEKNLMS